MSKRIVFFLLTLAAATGIARAQSLADVAKKEEERRKALPAPVKVYTNKDLNAVPPPPVPASKPADAKSGEKAETAAPDAKEFELRATRGTETYGICSTPSRRPDACERVAASSTA